MNRYIPLYRPASFSTLPQGIKWDYVEAPAMPGLCNRPELKRSSHCFGVIELNRALTADEREQFELRIA